MSVVGSERSVIPPDAYCKLEKEVLKAVKDITDSITLEFVERFKERKQEIEIERRALDQERENFAQQSAALAQQREDLEKEREQFEKMRDENWSQVWNKWDSTLNSMKKEMDALRYSPIAPRRQDSGITLTDNDKQPQKQPMGQASQQGSPRMADHMTQQQQQHCVSSTAPVGSSLETLHVTSAERLPNGNGSHVQSTQAEEGFMQEASSKLPSSGSKPVGTKPAPPKLNLDLPPQTMSQQSAALNLEPSQSTVAFSPMSAKPPAPRLGASNQVKPMAPVMPPGPAGPKGPPAHISHLIQGNVPDLSNGMPSLPSQAVGSIPTKCPPAGPGGKAPPPKLANAMPVDAQQQQPQMKAAPVSQKNPPLKSPPGYGPYLPPGAQQNPQDNSDSVIQFKAAPVAQQKPKAPTL